MDYVNRHFAKWPNGDEHGFVRPKIECRSGLKISVQASLAHMCEPRQNHCSNYSHVEVYMPVEVKQGKYSLIEDWYQYGDDPEHKRPQLFAYVPVELVNRLIRDHGGPIE